MIYLAYYRAPNGRLHWTLKTEQGRTLRRGTVATYRELVGVCPRSKIVKIVDSEPPRPAPRWAFWTRLVLDGTESRRLIAVAELLCWAVVAEFTALAVCL